MYVFFLPDHVSQESGRQRRGSLFDWYLDDVIKCKCYLRYWPFVQGIHRLPVNSPHKGQWRGALMFSLICAWINGWVNNSDAVDLRCHRSHYDVSVMMMRNEDGEFRNEHHMSHFSVYSLLDIYIWSYNDHTLRQIRSSQAFCQCKTMYLNGDMVSTYPHHRQWNLGGICALLYCQGTRNNARKTLVSTNGTQRLHTSTENDPFFNPFRSELLGKR